MKLAHLKPDMDIRAWAKRLVDDLNGRRDEVSGYPTFADDAAAEAGGLRIGGGYVTASGEVRRRVA